MIATISTAHKRDLLGFIFFQNHNALRITYRGYGLRVGLANFTPTQLANAMNEIITNTTYKEAIQHASTIMRSRPLNARQLAGYWVDHVIKFGSKHMRSHAYDIPLYQFMLLDVIGFLILCSLIVSTILSLCVFKLCKSVNKRYAESNIVSAQSKLYKSE